MKRPVSSLFAAAATGAALLSALPASAQTFSTYTQNFDGTTMTPTGTSGGTGKAAVTAGQSVIINAARSANYGDASQSAKSTVTVAGTTQTVGSSTFTNQADSGNQAANVTWQAASTVTTGATGLEAFTTASSTNARPIVDLGGTVSFNMYVFSSSGSSVNVNLEVEENSTYYYDADTTTDTFAPVPTTVSAQPDLLGMRGSDNTAETDIWAVGAAGKTTSGTTGFPSDGKTVTSGSWQTVTFNLPTAAHTVILDTGGTTGYRTSGLGSIYGMDFVPTSVDPGGVYSVYIDDFTITAAPAPGPSEWAGMGIGAAALLGLALRARRRNAGLMAA